VLDGAAVFGQGQVEGGATGAALVRIFGRAAGGVVVVTKFFVAEAGAAAAASVGEDVAALIAFFGLDCCVLHGGTPLPCQKCAKYSKEKACIRTSMQAFGLNGKARRWPDFRLFP